MKKKETPHRTSKTLEHIKTFIMAALLICLIVLVAVYVGGMQLYRADTGQNESFDRLWSPQSEAPEGLEKTRLIPEFIGYKQASDESAWAAFANASAIWDIYELVTPALTELFGADSVCRQLSASEGERVFTEACMSEELVYIRYHTPILYQLIYAYSADRLALSESDVAKGESGSVGAYVSELVIVPDDNFAAHRFVAIAADGGGNYYEFRPGSHVVSSDFYISKLASGAQSVETVPFTFSQAECFTTPEPIVDGEIEVLHFTQTDTALTEDAQNKLLSLFGYNIDKLSGYSDENGYVYIDSHSQLRLGSGYISFTTDDASGFSTSLRGIRIDSLLGYTSSDTSGLFDKLTAADNLIRKLGELSPPLVGAMGLLCLGDVYTDGGRLVIEYFLTLDGVRIGKEPYFRAVFTEETISEVTVYSKTLEISSSTELVPSARFTLNTLFGLDKLPADKRILSMRLAYTDTGAKWNVILDK